MYLLRGWLGTVLLLAALSGAGTASADLVIAPDLARAICPGARFLEVVPPRHKYADEEAGCTVFSPDGGAEVDVSIQFLTFSSRNALFAQVKLLHTHTYKVLAYGMAGNPQGDAFSLVYANAMVENYAASAHSLGQQLMTRLKNFGFEVYYF